MKVTSTIGMLKKISHAGNEPYVSLERYVRELIRHNGWQNRNRQRLLVGDLPNLLTALAAPLPSKAMDGVRAGHKLRFNRLITAFAPDNAVGCDEDDAWFGVFYGHPTLHTFISDAIQTLGALAPVERKARATRLRNSGWSLTICVDPMFASVVWYETHAKPRVTYWQTMEWTPPQEEYSGSINEFDGIRRPIQISALVLLAAAEIYADANAADTASSLLPESAPSAGVSLESKEADSLPGPSASSENQPYDDTRTETDTAHKVSCLHSADFNSCVCGPSSGVETSTHRTRSYEPHLAPHHHALL